MPTDDVSDLRDVFDAINILCDTMKSSNFEDETYEDCSTYVINAPQFLECTSTTDLISPEEVSIRKVEIYHAERWSDVTSPPDDIETVTSDTEPAIAHETISEMYYTASSEVSLLSDTEIPEKVHEEEATEERKECVIAGHVAAMRERFESMTRTNTPCPDLIRSMSPSLDVFSNITPSPDHLG